MYIDTTGQEEMESSNDSESKFNTQEANLTICHVLELISANVLPESIGIISPYQSQVQLISSMLKSHYPQIECSSVDGFQGREKEVIIVSLVRCNSKGEVGFLQSKNRLNVALTRPKRHLCVIGNGMTLNRDTSLKPLIDYLEENAELFWHDDWEKSLDMLSASKF
jgi:DNA polymerase alpha-associated DNA helicase A